jgi:hypothetical protein
LDDPIASIKPIETNKIYDRSGYSGGEQYNKNSIEERQYIGTICCPTILSPLSDYLSEFLAQT